MKEIKHLSANAWDYLTNCKIVIKRVPSLEWMVDQSMANLQTQFAHYEKLEYSPQTYEDPSLPNEITVGLLFHEKNGIKKIKIDMCSFLPYAYQLTHRLSKKFAEYHYMNSKNAINKPIIKADIMSLTNMIASNSCLYQETRSSAEQDFGSFLEETLFNEGYEEI